MARVGCFCGEAMSNVDERRTNMMSVYKKRDVWRTLERLGDIRLFDFVTNWYEGAAEQVNEYWFCRMCKRFYVLRGGRGREIYRRIRADASACIERGLAPAPPSDWQELYVFSDIRLYWITEADENIGLREFLAMPRRHRYFISPDQETVYITNTETGTVDYLVLLEERRQ